MFAKKPAPEPTNDQRGAQVAVDRESLLRVNGERERRKAAKQATAAAHTRAKGVLDGIRDNHSIAVRTTPEERAAANQSFIATEEAAAQAASALAAHEAEYDLVALGNKLRQNELRLNADRFISAYAPNRAKLVHQISEVTATENAGERILTDAFRAFPERVILDDGTVIERGAGLTDCQFPEGVFGPAAPKSHLSGDAQVTSKSIFVDQVLLATHLLFPTIPMPPEAAARVSELKSLTAAGQPKPRWFVSAISWSTERARRLGK